MTQDNGVIDLGLASEETKGPGGEFGDVGLNIPQAGLTDD